MKWNAIVNRYDMWKETLICFNLNVISFLNMLHNVETHDDDKKIHFTSELFFYLFHISGRSQRFPIACAARRSRITIKYWFDGEEIERQLTLADHFSYVFFFVHYLSLYTIFGRFGLGQSFAMLLLSHSLLDNFSFWGEVSEVDRNFWLEIGI